MTSDEKLQLILEHVERVSATVTDVSRRLDVVEGRIGPPAVELPPDHGREDCPEGVRYNPGNSFYYRDVMTSTGLQSRKVCEACWTLIPRYVDFPEGLVSPDDRKSRMTTVEGKVGRESQPEALCLPCYVEAFARVYPGAALPEFSSETYPDDAVIPPALTGAGRATIAEPGKETVTLELAVR
jgi:hypothetical protein